MHSQEGHLDSQQREGSRRGSSRRISGTQPQQQQQQKDAPLSPHLPTVRRMSRLEPRKGSFLQNFRLSMSRMSFSGHSWGPAGQGKTSVKVGNTYRMAPEPDDKFKAPTAAKFMREVMSKYMMGEKYDSTLAGNLCKNLADLIRDRAKNIGFSQRYKYVVQITMGHDTGQCMRIVSRCVWNTETDNYASALYRHGSLYVSATLYALYFE